MYTSEIVCVVKFIVIFTFEELYINNLYSHPQKSTWLNRFNILMVLWLLLALDVKPHQDTKILPILS